jgi:hypothetical protein
MQWIRFRVSYDLRGSLPSLEFAHGFVDVQVALGGVIREFLPSGTVVYRQVAVVPPPGVTGSPEPARSALPIPVLSAADLFVAKSSVGELAPGVIALPQAVDDAMVGFWRAARGFPSAASNEIARFVYLSAMTITTVGYGDIVPLTDRARLWTAFEAVYGVVVAGIFLASLATQARRGDG